MYVSIFPINVTYEELNNKIKTATDVPFKFITSKTKTITVTFVKTK